MAMAQNYQPPKMDGFPTKHDNFCGSFCALILSHSHIYILMYCIHYIELIDQVYINPFIIGERPTL